MTHNAYDVMLALLSGCALGIGAWEHAPWAVALGALGAMFASIPRRTP